MFSYSIHVMKQISQGHMYRFLNRQDLTFYCLPAWVLKRLTLPVLDADVVPLSADLPGLFLSSLCVILLVRSMVCGGVVTSGGLLLSGTAI